MRKIFVLCFVAMSFLSCSKAERGDGGGNVTYAFTPIKYVQYASGGITTDTEAMILFENSNSTFTRYQIAFVSCTCRGAASNFVSLMYVELLNSKTVADDSLIRAISFGQKGPQFVGMWGDGNPLFGTPDYTADYMNEHYVQKLVGVSKAEIDGWAGFGSQLSVIDADAVTGATVTTSNIVSVLQSLYGYHAEKYCNG